MSMSLAQLTLFGLGLFPLAGATEASGAGSRPEPDGAHDFDFLFGTFHVANRVLEKRLVGSNEWTTFEATNVARPILGGLGNIDEYRPKTWRPGYIGSALRLFNPQTKKWSIYWMDSRRGVVDPPVIGEFHGDVGRFEGEDEWDGRPIRVRFTWTRSGVDAPRWEQAFSSDQGITWETNWIMEFTRTGPAAIEAPRPSTTMSSTEGSHGFDFLFGESRVANRVLESRLASSHTWKEFGAVVMGQPILGGLGMIEDYRPIDGRPGFIGVSLRLFNPNTKKWSIYGADNQRGVLDPPVVGEFHDNQGVFEGLVTYNGRSIAVRYSYTRLGQNFGRWEQAFTPDEGKTWETNWTMEFTPPVQTGTRE